MTSGFCEHENGHGRCIHPDLLEVFKYWETGEGYGGLGRLLREGLGINYSCDPKGVEKPRSVDCAHATTCTFRKEPVIGEIVIT